MCFGNMQHIINCKYGAVKAKLAVLTALCACVVHGDFVKTFMVNSSK